MESQTFKSIGSDMTSSLGRCIALAAIAFSAGQFSALTTVPAYGQSQDSDGTAWCDTTWACDTVGPTSDPVDGKFAALVSAVAGDYVATGQASEDAARNLARSKCANSEP